MTMTLNGTCKSWQIKLKMVNFIELKYLSLSRGDHGTKKYDRFLYNRRI